jgi:hypothetical protein
MSPAAGRATLGSTGVRACGARIEGGPLPRRSGDKVIGPLNLFNLPAAWSDGQANEAKDGRGYRPPPGLHAQPMKEIVTVRAGETITVVVPRSERRWFSLLFNVSPPKGLEHPESAITFKACRLTTSRQQLVRECGSRHAGNACRWGYTEFNGGVYVDFDRAPLRGRCARLYVQRPGSKPIVGYPFVQDPATCRR